MKALNNPFEERVHYLKLRIDAVSNSMRHNENIDTLRSPEYSPTFSFKSNIELYKDLCDLEIELVQAELNYNSFKELNKLRDELVQYRNLLRDLKRSVYDKI